MKMGLKNSLRNTVGVFATLVCIHVVQGQGQAAQNETFCGLKEAEANKTCISVRLPWQEAPIYFCTAIETLKYKSQCTDHLARYCPSETSANSLLIATPWDCCPLSSTPDYCSDRTCPAAPLNRTCKEIAPDPSKPWDCCPTYFCDEGDISSCQMKRLQPGCLTPPKNKKNCVAFKDGHGCCYKFQCEGEGKPGMCPAQVQALQFKRVMDNSVSISSTSSSIAGTNTPRHTTTHTTSKPLVPSNATTTVIATRVMKTNQSDNYHYPITTDLSCVGDFNCPGQMKCCSTMMSTYYDYEGGRTTSSRFGNQKDKAVYGQCVEHVTFHE